MRMLVLAVLAACLCACVTVRDDNCYSVWPIASWCNTPTVAVSTSSVNIAAKQK